MEKRRGALIDIDRNALAHRMRVYFNPKTDWNDLRDAIPGLTENAARFDAKKTRVKVLNVEKFLEDRMIRYVVRPFDVQWCYYSGIRLSGRRADLLHIVDLG